MNKAKRADASVQKARLENLTKALELLAPRMKDESSHEPARLKPDFGLLLGEQHGMEKGMADKREFRLFSDGVAIIDVKSFPSRRLGDTIAGWKKEVWTVYLPHGFADYLVYANVPVAKEVVDAVCLKVAAELEKWAAHDASIVADISKILRNGK
jgi:hypothetical protein